MIYSHRRPIEIWQVCVPKDTDITKYIDRCYSTNTISLTNGYEYIHNVIIGTLALQQVEFPTVADGLGSGVVTGHAHNNARHVVLDVLPNRNANTNGIPWAYNFTKSNGRNSAGIIIRGESGDINIDVDSKDENGGEVTLNISHFESKGKLNINVQGDVVVNADNTGIKAKDSIVDQVTVVSEVDNPEKYKTVFSKTLKGFEVVVSKGDTQTTLKYDTEVGFTYSDEFDNKILLNSDGVQVISGNNLVNLGEGAEPMVLGDTLAQLLKDLIAEIAKSTTASGPLLNAATIASYSSKVDTIKSDYSKTD